MTVAPLPWLLEGTYFESCNCDAVCPCRSIGGRPGGRSTNGVCQFALSWLILNGHAGGGDLAGLAVVLIGEYDDDEPGSPWRFLLHVDDRGSETQQNALTAIFLGRLGGDRILNLPWIRKPSELVSVYASNIEIDHTPRKQWFRVGETTIVRVSGPVQIPETVTCGIPGHDRRGEELYTQVLRVDDDPFRFEYTGNCAYASDFAYRSD